MEKWTGITRSVAEGATEPCTAAEVKAQLRITHTTDDTMIGALINAARNAVEIMSGRFLVTTTVNVYFDAFPIEDGEDEILYFPGGDVSSFTSLKYYDSDGTLQTLSSSKYQTDLVSNPCRVCPSYGEAWPGVRDMMNAVILTYSAKATITPAMKQAVIMLACDMYEHPEAQFEERPILVNPQFQRLVNTFKMMRTV